MKKSIVNFLKYLKFSRIQKGSDSVIGLKTKTMNNHNIFLGKNSYINGGYLLSGKNFKIIIGDNCLLSYEIHLRTSSHNYLNKEQLIRLQGEFEKDIVIGNDCWIGFGAQVLPGVNIADGSVIGAGAIVTNNTEPYSVYAGVPARKIKNRVRG